MKKRQTRYTTEQQIIDKIDAVKKRRLEFIAECEHLEKIERGVDDEDRLNNYANPWSGLSNQLFPSSKTPLPHSEPIPWLFAVTTRELSLEVDMPNQQSLTEYVTRLSQLERENQALKKQIGQKFGCFKCGDGATPLYCLNCAIEENGKSLLARLEEARSVLDLIDKQFGSVIQTMHSKTCRCALCLVKDWLKGTP